MKKVFLIMFSSLCLLVACQSQTSLPTATNADTLATLKGEVAANYADMVFASYQDSLQTVLALQEALQNFVAVPSPEGLEAAKLAWLASREPYGQTEVYRFYGGPIDDADGPEGLLNAWPLDEAYIDYVDGAETAGIINNPDQYPEITTELLVSLNEMGAEENISSGYHAIEFLLWGQDLGADGSGNRPYTDYTTAANAGRRAQYLLAAAELLVTHLQALVNEWDPAGTNTYRQNFLAQTPDQALQQILTGMGVLSKSELAGERMFVAYDNQDQEDEHSCFSDNTHRDIAANAQGIFNVYSGSYKRVDGTMVNGPSLADLLTELDPQMAAEMAGLAEAALAQVAAIHAPFDQAIVLAEHRPAVLAAVNALQDQGDKIAEIANLLGLSINTDLP